MRTYFSLKLVIYSLDKYLNELTLNPMQRFQLVNVYHLTVCVRFEI